MRRTLILLMALGALAPAAAWPAPSSVPGAPAHRHAAASGQHAASKTAGKTHASAADSASVSPDRAAARTLEDIHIEGEIPVPQVLFITAREQRRFMEFQHHRYLKSSHDVGASTVPPSRIVMSRAQTPPERSHPDD
jgi:hypothetical protein